MSAHPVPRPPRFANHPKAVTRYRKGDVWLVVSDPDRPPVGTEIWPNRPALVVSADTLNDHSGFVCVVYLSQSPNKRSSPTHVQVPSHDRNGTSMALCEQVHTVDTSRLVRHLGSIPFDHVKEVDKALAFALSLGRNPDGNGLFKKWEEYIKVHGIDMRAEIEALAGATTDQRVEALQRALALMTDQRDAYKVLVETRDDLPGAMSEVTAVLGRDEGTPREEAAMAEETTNNTPRGYDEIVEAQGWDTDSQLALALEYIEAQDSPEAWLDHLERAAAIENDTGT